MEITSCRSKASKEPYPRLKHYQCQHGYGCIGSKGMKRAG
jgi:hypothetical protein